MTKREKLEWKLNNWLADIITNPRATKHRGTAILTVERLKRLNDFSLREAIRNRILRSRVSPSRFQLWLIALDLPTWEDIFTVAELK